MFLPSILIACASPPGPDSTCSETDWGIDASQTFTGTLSGELDGELSLELQGGDDAGVHFVSAGWDLTLDDRDWSSDLLSAALICGTGELTQGKISGGWSDDEPVLLGWFDGDLTLDGGSGTWAVDAFEDYASENPTWTASYSGSWSVSP